MKKPTSLADNREKRSAATPIALLPPHNMWRPEVWLLSAAEIAGMTITAPATRPEVVDVITRVGAIVFDLAHFGALPQMSPAGVARELYAPYTNHPEWPITPYLGFKLLAAADAAGFVCASVTAPPAAGDPVWATREMPLHERLAELAPGAEAEYNRRARHRGLLAELRALSVELAALEAARG